MPSSEPTIQPSVKDNVHAIKIAFNFTQDIVIQSIQLNESDSFTIVYLSGMADPGQFLKKIPLQSRQKQSDQLIEVVPTKQLHTIKEIVDEIIKGNTITLFDGMTTALSYDTNAVNTRSVNEPDNEVSIKGPHDGFNESMKNNIALVRFHCPSPLLTVEYLQLGTITHNKVAVLSMKGIVNEKILQEVHNRLKRIPYEAVLDIQYIEEWITDNRWTLFPLIESTERPDRVVGALLEGRVAIMLNGVPMTLMVPYLFLQTFQVSEDYYWRYYLASALRLLRFFCGFVTLYLPAFFVATITFHHEFLPTTLLMSIAQGHEPVPYPTLVEVLLMEGAFEILREAGIRLPRQVGSAVSIVGALVLGQAAVQAGIVSPVTVILVAFTGICSFTLPTNTGAYAIRMLRFVIIIMGGLLGYVGIITAGILLLVHLVSLRSFGIPYFSPLAPYSMYNSTDIFIRRPHFLNKKRPSIFRVEDDVRFRE
ncbi:spore germination protein [Brevibacillus ginsengisoli]|uniref:spore germination protein n=1 Tax=Brevibacillus ginsengisoli TaxID=363854 RepID=UPI003CFA2726